MNDTTEKKSIGQLVKKFWWVLLILLVLIGGGVYVAVCGLPWSGEEEAVDTTPASTDPFDLDITKGLDYNLDIIKRYLQEDEWSLDRFSVYKEYLDPFADDLNENQRPIYDELIANYNFRYRLNNGQWNQPEGASIVDVQYDSNLGSRQDLAVSMSDGRENFGSFYEQNKEALPGMHFSEIANAWNESNVKEPEPAPVVAPQPREPKAPKEKEVVETPSQKLVKALKCMSPQVTESTIREQVFLNRYPKYATQLQALAKKIQQERNSSPNHRASEYENCVKAAEDFEDLCVRYGI